MDDHTDDDVDEDDNEAEGTRQLPVTTVTIETAPVTSQNAAHTTSGPASASLTPQFGPLVRHVFPVHLAQMESIIWIQQDIVE